METSPSPTRCELPAECEAFQQVLEKEVLQEPVPESEARRARDHGHDCRHCASMASSLRALAEPPAMAFEELDRISREVLSSHDRERARKARRGRLVLVAAALSATAAAVVAVAVWYWPVEGAGEVRTSVLLDSGRLHVEGRARLVQPGDRVITGRRLAAVQPGTAVLVGRAIRLHPATGARFELVEAAARSVRLRLSRGGIAVAVVPRQRIDLTLETPICSVVVTGTTFFVEMDGDDAIVDVLEGRVQVDSRLWKSGPVLLSAGHSLRVRKRRKLPLDPRRRAWILALLDAWAAMGANAEPGSNPMVPERAAASGRKQPPPLKADVNQRRRRRPRLDASTGTRRRPASVGPDEPTAPSRSPTAKAPSPPTEGQLFQRARACLLRRSFKCAAAAYRELIRRQPGKGTSITALVSLASIELAHLGQASRALDHFNRYLRKRPRGALAAESLYGKCRALRALGRRAAELRALKRFLSRHSTNVSAPRARARLKKLEGPM